MEVLGEAANATLLAELDDVLLELRRRLDRFLTVADEEIVELDEGFTLAGLVAASAGEAARHAEAVRDALRARVAQG